MAQTNSIQGRRIFCGTSKFWVDSNLNNTYGLPTIVGDGQIKLLKLISNINLKMSHSDKDKVDLIEILLA